jgi:hypothetical protein
MRDVGELLRVKPDFVRRGRTLEGAEIGPELLLQRCRQCLFVVMDQHHETHCRLQCRDRSTMPRL